MKQISPTRKGEWITIRFTHEGFRYLLSGLGKWENPEDLEKAQRIAQKITLDIHLGVFSCGDSKELAKVYLAVPTEHGLKEKLTQRLEHKYHTSDKTLLSHLVKWGRPVNSREDAIAFITWLSKGLAPSSVNRHLNTLKVLEPELFKGLALKVPPKPLPDPFTRDEVRLITQYFRENNPHYYPFVLFLFYTGARVSEAIGLQWKHIDLNRGLAQIYETLGRDQDRSSHRVRRGAKGGKLRVVPLHPVILELLKGLDKGNPDRLVFPSPQGHSLDDRNFSQRVWRKALKALNIPYRPPYNCRHTFVSHFLEETKDFIKCASITHNSKSGVQTLISHYAGLVSGIKIPDMF